MKIKIIEAAPFLGGKLPYYSEKFLYDVGGIAAITAGDLTKQLEKQARIFEPTLVYSQLIEKMERLEDGTFRLTSNTGEKHLTRSILLTIGFGTLVANKLEVPGAAQYEGRHLHYRPINVEQFRAHEGNVVQLQRQAVAVMTSSRIKEIYGNDDRIDSVKIERLDMEELFTLEVDEILPPAYCRLFNLSRCLLKSLLPGVLQLGLDFKVNGSLLIELRSAWNALMRSRNKWLDRGENR
ncbi:hypothetical protein GCM10010913_44190 [Paenibacillus aceti]|uniref:FAD dependent oxidoreductase domain-containing protein n=2 Tax=Paenibacillus aceti TaxID=1820010 RepID=A0ABQ1W7M8_9BACL|nr:NAD(P)/FAD-dependent oxidoreductase [Paenibacillus aceti]GGG17311.1 hypothetical protein GCM10010913_44190 [Paenibacillus aceti]